MGLSSRFACNAQDVFGSFLILYPGDTFLRPSQDAMDVLAECGTVPSDS